MDELKRLSEELLETIQKEDMEHFLKKGGFVNGKCKAAEVQSQN